MGGMHCVEIKVYWHSTGASNTGYEGDIIFVNFKVYHAAEN